MQSSRTTCHWCLTKSTNPTTEDPFERLDETLGNKNGGVVVSASPTPPFPRCFVTGKDRSAGSQYY